MKKRNTPLTKFEREALEARLAESRQRRADRGPSGLSLRSLIRAASSGWAPTVPSEKAIRRHADHRSLGASR